MTETTLPTPPDSFYVRVGKRLFDLTLGLMLGFVTLPFQLLLGAVVRVKLGSPVLFRQPRAGLDGQVFQVVKFRSMTDARDAQDILLPDDQRLPPFGRVLRSTSLDELPEILNVVKGDMSLVGPRPLMAKYLPRYSARHARRHTVRPGLTGLAQVSGRNSMEWTDRFESDIEYVENVSLRLDLGIIARTLITVFRREGVAEQGEATMTEFLGDLPTDDPLDSRPTKNNPAALA